MDRAGGQHAVTLALVRVPERVADEQLALLADDERAALARFTDPADARRFAVRRATVRELVGSALGRDPAMLAIDRTCRHCGAAHGKPRYADELDVSVASAGELVAIAIAHGGSIGVDVASADHHVPDAAFAAGDRAQPRILAWCAKEAILKAAGFGLAIEPDRVTVARSQGRWIPTAVPEALAGFALHTGDHAGYVWAVATRPDRALVMHVR